MKVAEQALKKNKDKKCTFYNSSSDFIRQEIFIV